MSSALPLSSFQYAVWKGQKLHPSTPLYNMCFTFEIFGQLDKTVFTRAFHHAAKETSVLNLVIDANDRSVPTQTFGKMEHHIDYIDASTTPDFDFKQWIQQKNGITFDLRCKSYYSALLRFGDEHYVWYINHHHIFNDVFSFQLLYDRISNRYTLLNNLESSNLSQESDSSEYEKYLSTHKSNNRPKQLTRHKPIKLYGEGFSHLTQTASKRHFYTLKNDLVKSIFDTLEKHKLKTISPNLDLLTYLISSLLTTLFKVGDVGDPLYFSNIFSTRISPGSRKIGQPAIELAHSMIESLRQLDFNDLYQKVYSFLVKRTNDADNSLTVLPAVVFNFFDLNIKSFSGFDTRCQWLDNGHVDDHHFLRFHIYRYNYTEDFVLAIDLKKGHPDEKVADRFYSDFTQTIQENLLNRFDHSISDYCLLTPLSLKRINQELERVNNASLRKDKYLMSRIRTQLRTNTNKTAIYFKDEVITYHSLTLAAKRVTSYIDKIRLPDGARVVIYLARSEKLVYTILGTLLANVAYVPVSASTPIERLKYIINDVRPDLLIHDRDDLEFDLPSILFDDIPDVHSNEYESVHRTLDPFYILYTSGSTGRPKGVPISHKSVSNYISSAISVYLPADEIYHMPLFTSIGFDLTVSSFFLPLATGGSIYIYEEQQGIDLTIKDIVKNNRINCFRPTPSHLNLLEDESINENIRSVVTGGEKLTRVTAEKLHDLSNGNLTIYNEYGPTEATVGCIIYKYNPTTSSNSMILPIGRAMKNTAAFVTDSSGTPVPQGVVGELCLSGLGLTSGYLNDPKLNQEKFPTQNSFIQSKYYRTGDNVRLNASGDFEYVGRIDNQIKVGGFRIELGEIEKTISLHPTVGHCVAVYFENELQRGQIVAFIQGTDINFNKIKAFISKYLPSYMVPAKFIEIDSLPLTTNGKLDMNKLLTLLEAENRVKTEPSNEIEEVLWSIWKEVMGNKVLSTDDDFFELGGTSLDAIRIAARLEKMVNYELPVNYVFEIPTIQGLASHIMDDMRKILAANNSNT